jgi:hypothetical protein
MRVIPILSVAMQAVDDHVDVAVRLKAASS